MRHDIQKIISYYNLYLFFPICRRKEFKLFQLLESFKKMCQCTIHLLRNLWLMQHEEKCSLVKEFLFHNMWDWNFLKMHVSEIHVKQIRVNQGLGVK